MMKIASFDRENLRHLRAEIGVALADVAKKYEIALNVGAISFQPRNCTIKIEAATKAPDGTIVNREAMAFKTYCGMFGLEPEDLGCDFVYGGLLYRITGLKPSAPKFPILAERIHDRKPFKFPHTVVLAGIRRSAAA